jgi:hydroxyacylglutathione hydrolase
MALHLQQHYLACLSHASYFVGDTVSGRAVVVDPQRDISAYLAEAREHGMRITHVIETHFHADFLSGHLELARETGAEIVFGAAAAGRTDFTIRAMHDGETIVLGDSPESVHLTILETPGHTPESISIVVRESRDAAPYSVLTGDTLFIGDVGRPDLLSAVGHDADTLARQLYSSLHDKLLALPDATLVHPAHGAGSACGKNLSTNTVSTIGEQRRTNYALAPMSIEAFVEAVTEGQAVAPLYFLFAATSNRKERETFDEDRPLAALSIDDVERQRDSGAAVLDTRDDADFANGHLRGSINVGLGGRFAEYAGEVIEPGQSIVIVAEPGKEREAMIRLARIGFDSVIGHLEDPVRSFLEHPELVRTASRLTAPDFATVRESVPGLQLVDVRGPGEFRLGTIDGARPIELAALTRQLDDLDPARPVVVFCAGGYRSSIAASTLRSRGYVDVSDIIGGYNAWTSLVTA